VVPEVGLVHTWISAIEIRGCTEVSRDIAEVASVRLYSNVSNYYARTAIGNAYDLRAVDQREMRPPR